MNRSGLLAFLILLPSWLYAADTGKEIQQGPAHTVPGTIPLDDYVTESLGLMIIDGQASMVLEATPRSRGAGRTNRYGRVRA